jgi:hypothetical protein
VFYHEVHEISVCILKILLDLQQLKVEDYVPITRLMVTRINKSYLFFLMPIEYTCRNWISNGAKHLTYVFLLVSILSVDILSHDAWKSNQVLLILPNTKDAKPPANPPIIILMGCPYVLQNPLNSSLISSGEITVIVKFACLVI